jgi:hypothetical protein
MAHQGSAAPAPGARIVHDIPGRLRLRLSPTVFAPPVVDAIRDLDGVESGVWSPVTRSLLVLYDPRSTSVEQIARAVPNGAVADATLAGNGIGDAGGNAQRGDAAEPGGVEQAGGIVGAGGIGRGGGHGIPAVTPSVVARAVTGTVGALDARVRLATGGIAGLGTLIPLALALWAARELMLGRVGPLSWSSALWYAHGLFRDYSDS